MQNKHKVPKKQWDRWSTEAQRAFIGLYEHMTGSQFAYLHPQADPPNPEHWKTTAWNAAWMAANAVDEAIPDKIITIKAA